MAEVPLSRLAKYCDALLQTQRFSDWPGAANGLQVENCGTVSRIAAAVDGSLATIRLAVERGADLLVVHHGLFWSPSHPWVGNRHKMIRLLVESDLAVYSSHLPLDAHPELGNNSLLARSLGFKKTRPFFFEKNQWLGVRAQTTLGRDALAGRLEKSLGNKPLVIPGGPLVCRKIGIVTGGAGQELKLAAEEGVDTFITGEGPHWTFAQAEELGLNVFYGGHYATETFGVKALAQHLSRKFKIPWVFIDHPTGL